MKTPGQSQLRSSFSCTTGYLPGSFRSLVEFHPLIILYITTKITQKTTIFNGIIKPSQSICTFSFYLPFQALLIYLGFDPSSTENKWLISANRPWKEVPGAPGATTHQIQKPPEIWYSSSEFGSFSLDQCSPGPLVLIHRLSTSYCG